MAILDELGNLGEDEIREGEIDRGAMDNHEDAENRGDTESFDDEDNDERDDLEGLVIGLAEDIKDEREILLVFGLKERGEETLDGLIIVSFEGLIVLFRRSEKVLPWGELFFKNRVGLSPASREGYILEIVVFLSEEEDKLD